MFLYALALPKQDSSGCGAGASYGRIFRERSPYAIVAVPGLCVYPKVRPMILGVLSDTHRNHVLMQQAVDLMVERLGAVHLIHLGDDWEDKEYLDQRGYSVSGVPGLWCPAYMDNSVPRVRLDDFNGISVAYVHDIQAMGTVPSSTALLLSGHTHRPCIDLWQGIPHMNPGHLKHGKDRGQEATFGLIRLEAGSMSLDIYGLDGQTRQSRLFTLQTEEQGTEE